MNKRITELIQKSYKNKKNLDCLHNKLDEIIADKRIDDLKSGKTTLIPLEEVFKKAGIINKTEKIQDFLKS